MQRVYLPKFCISIVLIPLIARFRNNSYSKFSGGGGVDNKGNEKMVVTAPFCQEKILPLKWNFAKKVFCVRLEDTLSTEVSTWGEI